MKIGMNRLVALPFAVGVVFTFVPSPHAQELTPDPGAWRPLIHADLETELPDNLTYIDVWKDALTANNRAYDAKGAPRAAGQNAPASDAHVVVRSSRWVVVLTTLDTESGCKPAELSPGAGETIKMCPTRLVMFEGALSHTRDLPASCYLEIEPATATDPNDDASYAAFDTVTRTIKIGLIVNHRAVDECSRFISTAP
jgi:hypothetical protein